MNYKSAIFIFSYGRANNLMTYKMLLESGENSDRIYIIVSDDDKQLQEYYNKFGDKVITFSKEDAREMTDLCDNFENRKLVVFARNYIFKIARDIGLDCFIVLDDDYNRLGYRRIFNNNTLKGFKVKDIKAINDKCLEYLMKTPQLDCFAFAQDGDFIGGCNSFENIGKKRKIMNYYFFKTNNPIKFMGSINEDLSASVYGGQRGKVFFTVNDISVHQMITQTNKGGLTDIYLDSGTYIKSFYSVIVAPNCVKISAMGNKDLRIHHKVNWKLACPKIIREVVKNGSK